MRAAVVAWAVSAFAVAASASPQYDVCGRELPADGGRPVLELYANRHTRTVVREHALPFIADVLDARPVVVVRVDLSDVPRLLRGYAKDEVRRSYERTLAWAAEELRQRGIAAADLRGSLFYVVDTQGRRHREVGLRSGFVEAYARVLGPRGAVLASGPFPKSREDLRRALASR